MHIRRFAEHEIFDELFLFKFELVVVGDGVGTTQHHLTRWVLGSGRHRVRNRLTGDWHGQILLRRLAHAEEGVRLELVAINFVFGLSDRHRRQERCEVCVALHLDIILELLPENLQLVVVNVRLHDSLIIEHIID